MKAWQHFKTITHHRHLVRKECFRVGLYWQGLTHDLSKYSPTEFLVGAKYYQGTRSPNNAEREAIGYSTAWLHHIGRDKHHYEYWIDYSTKEIPGGMAPAPMPDKYIVEMVMDRIAACKVYNGSAYTTASPLQYYLHGKEKAPLHPRTKELLEKIKEKGVNVVSITLHVGLGTFRPVKVDKIEEHHMHTETFNISKEAADTINRTRAAGGRVIAVGTTSCRTLESAAADDGTIPARSGDTDIFIYPGYKFKAIDCLITNFHLPESTLIMLVSALAGRDNIMNAYETAVKERYRFFSFGDAMFIC